MTLGHLTALSCRPTPDGSAWEWRIVLRRTGRAYSGQAPTLERAFFEMEGAIAGHRLLEAALGHGREPDWNDPRIS